MEANHVDLVAIGVWHSAWSNVVLCLKLLLQSSKVFLEFRFVFFGELVVLIVGETMLILVIVQELEILLQFMPKGSWGDETIGHVLWNRVD